MPEPTTGSVATIRLRKRRLARRSIAWVLVVSAILVGLILVASTMVYKKDGDILIDNPTALIGGVIGSLGLVGAAMAPILLKMLDTTEVLKANVQNDHRDSDGNPLLMRDDLDDKHDEQMGGIVHLREDMFEIRQTVDRIVKSVEGVQSDIRGMRRDVGRVQDKQDINSMAISKMLRYQDASSRTHDDLSGRIALIEKKDKDND